MPCYRSGLIFQALASLGVPAGIQADLSQNFCFALICRKYSPR